MSSVQGDSHLVPKCVASFDGGSCMVPGFRRAADGVGSRGLFSARRQNGMPRRTRSFIEADHRGRAPPPAAQTRRPPPAGEGYLALPGEGFPLPGEGWALLVAEEAYPNRMPLPPTCAET